MHPVQFSLFIVQLPLRHAVQHASAIRRSSENIVVRCRLADGTEGWGEGVPRKYVTGETAEKSLALLVDTPVADQLNAGCRDWQDVIEMCRRFKPAVRQEDPRDCYGNALRCAVELSLLDAYGKLFGDPVSRVTKKFAPARTIRVKKQEVQYSGAITMHTAGREKWHALKMRLYGFSQSKVKVGAAGEEEEARLRRIRQWTGSRMDLRLDANEAWPADTVVHELEPLLRFNISAVEQPVPHAEVAALAEVRKQLPVPLMLDESLTSMTDAREAIRQGTCDLFNIRLSKCGGFLNALQLAATAHEAGLGYQLGCHPGESGLLSAAGRHWAVSVDHIRYLEGSYDRHLLKRLLTMEDITFGFGGRAPALSKPGLGVTVNEDVLREVTVRQHHFPVV